MAGRRTVADRLAQALGAVLGTTELPVRLRGWDGSMAGPAGRAGGRRPVAPGAAPAALVARASSASAARTSPARSTSRATSSRPSPRCAATAGWHPEKPAGPDAGASGWRCCAPRSRLGAIGPRARAPPEEVRLRRSAAGTAGAGTPRRSRTTTTSATTSTSSSSARRWSTPAPSGHDETVGLDAAQEAKLDLVCRKLGLRPGMRLLDVGCGWGSLAMHAAQHYGVDGRRHHAVAGAGAAGPQAGGRGRADRPGRHPGAGLPRRSTTARSTRSARSAWPSTWAAPRCRATSRQLTALLRPGGRLLNHAISWNAGDDRPGTTDTFIARYVFPDGELISLGDMVDALESGDSRCSTSRRCASTTR